MPWLVSNAQCYEMWAKSVFLTVGDRKSELLSGQSASYRYKPRSSREAEDIRGKRETDGELDSLGIYSEGQFAWLHKYPVLSDESKDIFQLYGVGKGMWGLTRVARVTFVIDREGTVKYVFPNTVMTNLNHPGSIRDALEGTMNYGAHMKFVDKWLAKELTQIQEQWIFVAFGLEKDRGILIIYFYLTGNGWDELCAEGNLVEITTSGLLSWSLQFLTIDVNVLSTCTKALNVRFHCYTVLRSLAVSWHSQHHWPGDIALGEFIET